jgi:hypothetical protein
MGERKTPKKIAAEAPKRGHLATMVFTGEKLKFYAHQFKFSLQYTNQGRAQTNGHRSM